MGGISFASAAGVDGKDHPHILTYQPERVAPWTALCTERDLTVCSSSRMWVSHVAYVGYALLLMVVLGFTCFPDGTWGDGRACAPSQNIKMCQLENMLQDSKSEFRFLIAFVLAGFVGATVRMWGVRRQNYAALCGNARNLNIQISALLPVNAGPVLNARRVLLARWVMLAFELAVLKPKGLMDSEAGREYLTAQGLLEVGEWEAMVPGDRHSTIFWWIQTELARLCREERVLEPEFVATIAQSIAQMRAQANDLMSSLDRDKPFSYTALCGLLVSINILIMSTWKGVQWAIWLRSFGDQFAAQPKFWCDIFALFAWNVSYKALYDLSYQLHSPFGDRRLDVAHETIRGGIRRLSQQIAVASERLPPSLRPPDDGKAADAAGEHSPETFV